MEFDDYQDATAETAIYREVISDNFGRINYTLLGLSGEVGELCNEFKKAHRDDGGVLTDERLARMRSELGDCLWYMSQLATELGVRLDVLAEHNLVKLRGRAARGTLGGSGEDR